MAEIHLVSFDTDRIKEYVFATEKLREIRGASRLLDQLNESDRMEKFIRSINPDHKAIFFGGGSGAVLAPSKEAAEKLIAAVEELYHRETVTASISGAAVPLNPGTETSGFGKRIEAAAFQLRRVKDKKARRIQASMEAFTQPCQVCERYPAIQVVTNEPLCDSCAIKRKVDEDHRRVEPRAIQDLEELGALAHPSGYIGFIYADGNNMGDLLMRLPDTQSYKKMAEGLRQLVTALPKQSTGSYEVLLAGGDDLMMVTTGETAIQTALGIARHFEQEIQKLLSSIELSGEKQRTLSVAVVLAHANFPITAFRSLAEQLLKRAKRRCAEEGYTTSAIDFMVVTSAGSSDLATHRDEVLTQKSFAFPHGNRQIRLTQRPYTLDEVNKLIDHICAFKENDFPQSQLQFLYEGIFQSQAEAIYRWGKVVGRAKKKHREALENFYQDFGDNAGELPPWKRGEENVQYTTALGDLVEIYQFV
jgi:CRISPR/Cas system-associated protein Cas10 (large subunit of type III CRISPR-Cas system)